MVKIDRGRHFKLAAPYLLKIVDFFNATTLGAYSRTQVARTIRQRSYDVDRSYDTTYSQS